MRSPNSTLLDPDQEQASHETNNNRINRTNNRINSVSDSDDDDPQAPAQDDATQEAPVHYAARDARDAAHIGAFLETYYNDPASLTRQLKVGAAAISHWKSKVKASREGREESATSPWSSCDQDQPCRNDVFVEPPETSRSSETSGNIALDVEAGETFYDSLNSPVVLRKASQGSSCSSHDAGRKNEEKFHPELCEKRRGIMGLPSRFMRQTSSDTADSLPSSFLDQLPNQRTQDDDGHLKAAKEQADQSKTNFVRVKGYKPTPKPRNFPAAASGGSSGSLTHNESMDSTPETDSVFMWNINPQEQCNLKEMQSCNEPGETLKPATHTKLLVTTNSMSINILRKVQPQDVNVSIEQSVYLAQIARLCSTRSPEQDYEFKAELGAGGYGKVYKCCSRKTGQKYAAKQLDILTYLQSNESLKYVVDEIEAMQNLRHENIVSFVEGFLCEDTYETVFIIDLVEGMSLSDVVEPRRGIRDEPIVCSILLAVTTAIQFIHSQNIIHRDIKSDNCMISWTGEIKLIDFGTCANLWANKTKFRKTTIGTPYWMAPEIYNGESYGFKVDCWSLGILGYECIVGVPPYYDMEPDQCLLTIKKRGVKSCLRNLFVTSDLSNFLHSSLKKKPRDRASAEQLVKHAFLTGGLLASYAEISSLLTDTKYHL